MDPALLLLALGCGGGAPAPAPAPPETPATEAAPPDLLIIAVDGLRADVVDPDHAPRISSWAADARRWTRAQAHGSWELPALASLLTGQPVHRHGVGRDPGRPDCVVGLPAGSDTLGSALVARGYTTAAFGLSDAARAAGLSAGFPGGPVVATRSGEHQDRVVADTAASWLAVQDGPAAALVHLHGPLPPFAPPAPFAGTRTAALPAPAEVPADWPAWAAGARPSAAWIQRVRALYAEEVAAVDAAVGALLASVDTERTWVVLTGTTGLDLWQDGALGTGHALTAGLTRVPLVVDGPGIVGETRTGVVGHAELLPAVLDAVGPGGSLSLGDARDGGVLLGGLRRGPRVEGRVDGQLRVLRTPATGVVETWKVTESGEEVPGGPAERALLPRALTRLEVASVDAAVVTDRPCLP